MPTVQTVATQVEQLPLFDYSQLPESQRLYVMEQTDSIKVLIREAAQKILEIGQRLLRVRSQLPDGAWGVYLAAEFGMTRQTATKYMRIASAFQDTDGGQTINNFATSALEALVAYDSSQDAIDEAIARAEGGEFINARLAEEIKQQTNGEWLRPQQTSLIPGSRRSRSAPSEPPAPKFSVGDRVIITLSEFDEVEAEITLIDPKRNASQWMYEASFTDASGKQKSRTFYESALAFPDEYQESDDCGAQRTPRRSQPAQSEPEIDVKAIALEGRLQALEEELDLREEELDRYADLLSELYTNCSRLNKECRALVLPGDLGDRIESLLHPTD